MESWAGGILSHTITTVMFLKIKTNKDIMDQSLIFINFRKQTKDYVIAVFFINGVSTSLNTNSSLTVVSYCT